MLKMFTTQLTGLFSRVHSKEELAIEDAARLLAQAAVGDGKIYIKGFDEMHGIVSEALFGEETMKDAHELTDSQMADSADRVLLITRRSTDEAAIALAKQLNEKDVPFAVICGTVKDAEEDVVSMAEVSLNTQVVKGLLPDESGARFGFPSLMAALYLYHGVKFTLDEMVEEY
ncbi:DUF2529 family protein [Jeotgalibacillus sp. S-D1]|uniref:DUF2529 domain-containing protein n=1 Tax=Jeotgalibacillus sp. S-D1 TaxID=2552189 RepID=UPI001059FE45|nr:DUF2529 domain-containing protein [Jeotgalibacillus sp. S-D1]TDL32959.1 DUF2529 family protein [Jeotgalibacillus sp. S-D1]